MLPDWFKYEIQEKWEELKELNLRKWINQLDFRVIIGITCVCFFLFLWVVIAALIPDRSAQSEEYEKVWFYDLNTDKLFTANSNELAPIDAPSGTLPSGKPAGVMAYVYTYKEEPNEFEVLIGYLEKLTDKGKEYSALFRRSRDNVTKDSIEQWNKERFIRTIEDANWVSADSAKGKAVMRKVSLPNEQGQMPIYYPPKENTN